MNLIAPVSSIMTKSLLTVSPDDPMMLVKEIFDKNKIHHIPVVRLKKIVGIISKSDFLSYYTGLSRHFEDRFINETLLQLHKAEEIMTKKIAKVEPTDRIAVAVEVFKENILHALPVVDVDDELVGIVTVHDIINMISKEKILDSDYKSVV
jgi:acetoin utilization protein AcuB